MTLAEISRLFAGTNHPAAAIGGQRSGGGQGRRRRSPTKRRAPARVTVVGLSAPAARPPAEVLPHTLGGRDDSFPKS